jgi:hypothetical protein
LWRGHGIGVIPEKVEPKFVDVLPELAGQAK